ncbi:MAG: sigma-54 dependent transcriptional regulator [Flavobacteriaceae bacterium]|nr:sigma-54 dependent transcriptional regulator [Flavobacteriaceae bacterium]
MRNNILVIEDDKSIREVIKSILQEDENDFIVYEASNGKEGLSKLIEKQFSLVLCDIKMPKMDGMDVLKRAKSKDIKTPFIMLTGHGNIETAVEAMKIGAYDFIQKPPDLNRLLISIRNAINNKNLSDQNLFLKRKISVKNEMIGSSKKLKQINRLIDKVSTTKARVLITGANGTGKELVANQIHQKSQVCDGPFIEVNCAAIPNDLIESELFGHVKGSFTSAIKDKKGKFELADNGTLFLDEIGDLSLNAQAKVLRALQENKINRVGSDKSIKINVRILAATNKNLIKEISKDRFREDLYHRIAVIVIEIPSLSERIEDMEELCEYFINLIAKDQGVLPKKISDSALNKLKKIKWKGNIRELRNVIERLMILGDDPISLKNITKFVSN